MPLTGPELGEGAALSLGVDLAMIFGTGWRSCVRLWPSPAASESCNAASPDSLAPGKQLAAGKQPAAAGGQAVAGSRVGGGGGSGGGAPLRQRLGRLLDSPLLPAAALAGAATAALGAAAASLSATAGASGWALRCLAGYAVAELGFQSFQCWRYSVCNAYAEAGPDLGALPAIRARFLRLHGVIDFREFLVGWFHGAPFESIWRGNVLEFVAYGFYFSTFEGLDSQQQAEALAFLAEAERIWNVSFPPGTNPDIAPMAHLWEPLRVVPKPLAVPLLSEAGGLLTRLLLKRQGYMRSRVGTFTFWVRLPAPTGSTRRPSADGGRSGEAPQQLRRRERGGSSESQGGDRSSAAESSDSSSSGCGSGSGKSARPLVFLHGVGLGLMPYLRFVRMLADAAPHHPVILAEAPHVALRLAGASLPVDALAHALAGVLRGGRFSGATFVAHSYGTFVASRMRQLHPELVHSLALLDPVCCMTCAPHLLARFIYKPVTRLSGLDGFLDIMRFVCSRDLSIAAAFCRSFFWTELMLWPEDMPPGRTLVVLSAHDDLVPVPLVTRQLEAAEALAEATDEAEADEAAAGSEAQKSAAENGRVEAANQAAAAAEKAAAAGEVCRGGQQEADGSSGKQRRAEVLLHPTAGHGGFLVDVPFQRRVVEQVQRLLLATDGTL